MFYVLFHKSTCLINHSQLQSLSSDTFENDKHWDHTTRIDGQVWASVTGPGRGDQ